MAPRLRYADTPPAKAISTDAATKPLMSTESSISDSSQETKTQEADPVARDHHDIFNLVALMVVVLATCINFDFSRMLSGPAQAWTGKYFMEMWWITLSYFFIDLVWVARVPTCVKSPDVIIKHHSLVMLYLIGPLVWPEYSWFMGACLSVEVNTWFLILRRVVHKRSDYLPQSLIDTVTISFYLSWIAIRCVVYPAILCIFLKLADDRIRETQTVFHVEMLFIVIHFFLCVLNLKWSYDLFSPMIKSFFGKEKSPLKVASGL